MRPQFAMGILSSHATELAHLTVLATAMNERYAFIDRIHTGLDNDLPTMIEKKDLTPLLGVESDFVLGNKNHAELCLIATAVGTIVQEAFAPRVRNDNAFTVEAMAKYPMLELAKNSFIVADIAGKKLSNSHFPPRGLSLLLRWAIYLRVTVPILKDKVVWDFRLRLQRALHPISNPPQRKLEKGGTLKRKAWSWWDDAIVDALLKATDAVPADLLPSKEDPQRAAKRQEIMRVTSAEVKAMYAAVTRAKSGRAVRSATQKVVDARVMAAARTLAAVRPFAFVFSIDCVLMDLRVLSLFTGDVLQRTPAGHS